MNDYNELPNGVAPDTRTPEEKTKDHLHEQMYGGMPAVWRDISNHHDWKLPSQRNQDGSNSCVMQSSATALEKFIGKTISASVYKLRRNAPEVGMWVQDAGDILYNTGTYYEDSVPSQNLPDSQMDATKLPQPTIVKATGYRTFIDQKDIDKIAEAIQAYGNCVLTFGSNSAEWQIKPIYNGNPATFYHAICAVDFGLMDGEKVLICRDSAGQYSSPTGFRIINDEYLNQRATGAIYYLGAKIIQDDNAQFHAEHSELSPEVTREQYKYRQGLYNYFINLFKALVNKK